MLKKLVKVLYMENPEASIKKNLLELKNKFSQDVEHKANVKILSCILYTSSELFEKDIRSTISFPISSKNIKYLEMR